MSDLVTRVRGWFTEPNWSRLARWRYAVGRVAAWEQRHQALGDAALRQESLSLRYRAKSGEPLERLLPEAFALVRIAAQRRIDQRHYDVQLLGGMALFERSIAEMQTGEGKTLTATLPLYLYALTGRGCHLATVNDYLAERDAAFLRPVYELLGMSTGVVLANLDNAGRRAAYACDITYGTAKEFGFDFLRDRLLLRRIEQGQADVFGRLLGEAGAGDQERPVQRGLHFALVDEADSVLIDEASTPLIIGIAPSGETTVETDCYRWASAVADQFREEEHYELDHHKHKVELTAGGRMYVRRLPKPSELDAVGVVTLYEFVERAIKVSRLFHREQHYVVRDGEIAIVDEFTGRIAEGRKWRDGIHQAIEAKEQIEIIEGHGQAARVTVQDFFSLYERLAGMTGTAASSAGELLGIYKLRVVPIPTNKPPRRKVLPPRVFGTSDAKWAAIVEEVRELHARGQPVLIGTRSIDKSEHISRLLRAEGIEHVVLNAHRHAEEARIVEQAGHRGRVTVATNMAGRGTDIRLGPGVAELGGLFVVATEYHDAARIDRQLIGRCGRQGDVGVCRQYAALDDDLLLNGYGARKADGWKEQGRRAAENCDRWRPLFRRAQRAVERRHYRQRKVLMYHERERHKAHRQMGQDPFLDAPG